MNTLDELVATADRLCKSLDDAAENEKRFCTDIQLSLEVYSWEVWRIKNNIEVLKERLGNG